MSKTVGYIPPKAVPQQEPEQVPQQEPESTEASENAEQPKAGKNGKGKKDDQRSE